MKLHIAEGNYNFHNGEKVVKYYKTLCGRKATTFEEAKRLGFMASVRMDNPDICKSCQNIMASTKYWKQYRAVSNTKKA